MTTETNAALVQGSPAWHAARLGKITASRFADILRQPQSKKDKEAGKLSATAQTYLLDIVAEILTGQSQDHRTTPAEQWGHDHEPAARQLYEEKTGRDVTQVGFYQHPAEPMIGGSPDGLVDDGEEGGIEIKCPYNTAVHLRYVLGDVLPKEHVAQVRGHLWLTGHDWWDFVSFDPRIKDLSLALWQVRVRRNNEEIDYLNGNVFAFRDKVLETLCKLKGEKREETT